MTVDVERVFSRGRVVLSYLWNRLNVQTVRALICVDEWIKAGIIKEKQMHDCLRALKEVEDDDEADVGDGWDDIDT